MSFGLVVIPKITWYDFKNHEMLSRIYDPIIQIFWVRAQNGDIYFSYFYFIFLSRTQINKNLTNESTPKSRFFRFSPFQILRIRRIAC